MNEADSVHRLYLTDLNDWIVFSEAYYNSVVKSSQTHLNAIRKIGFFPPNVKRNTGSKHGTIVENTDWETPMKAKKKNTWNQMTQIPDPYHPKEVPHPPDPTHPNASNPSKAPLPDPTYPTPPTLSTT